MILRRSSRGRMEHALPLEHGERKPPAGSPLCERRIEALSIRLSSLTAATQKIRRRRIRRRVSRDAAWQDRAFAQNHWEPILR
jgi:hypothetical protein